MKINIALGKFIIEDVNITIDVPDEIFNMHDFKEIVTASSGEPKHDNKTNPVFKAPTKPTTTVPKTISDFDKFKFEVERFMKKHNFERASLFYKMSPGENICIHICITDRHISLYVYKYAECEIYYNMSRDMTITRHNNSYVDNDVVRQIVGMFRRHSKKIADV